MKQYEPATFSDLVAAFKGPGDYCVGKGISPEDAFGDRLAREWASDAIAWASLVVEAEAAAVVGDRPSARAALYAAAVIESQWGTDATAGITVGLQTAGLLCSVSEDTETAAEATRFLVADEAYGLFLTAHHEQVAAHAAAIDARERVEATRSGHASAIASFASAAACYEQATAACERASADCSAAFAASRASTR